MLCLNECVFFVKKVSLIRNEKSPLILINLSSTAGCVLQHPHVVGGVRWQDTHSYHFEATPPVDGETDLYPDYSEANQLDASGLLAS